MAQPASLGTEIVKQVAEQKGVDPLELNPCLYDAIDPGALVGLVSGTDGPLRVTFSYHGYTITVDEGGTITVDERTTAESGDGAHFMP